MAEFHLNEVSLAGRIIAVDPPRTDRNGRELTCVRIVTERSYRDRDGVTQCKRDMHRIVIFNVTLASIAARFARPGRRVYIKGELTTRRYGEHTSVEIELGAVGAKFHLLDDPDQRPEAPGHVFADDVVISDATSDLADARAMA